LFQVWDGTAVDDEFECIGQLATDRLLEAYSSTGKTATVFGRTEVVELLAWWWDWGISTIIGFVVIPGRI